MSEKTIFRSQSALCLLLAIVCCNPAFTQPRPVIDVHFHTDTGKFLPREVIDGDLREMSPVTRAEMIRASLSAMDRFNIRYAITSGPDPLVVRIWRQAAPGRFIPALQIPAATVDLSWFDSVRELVASGQIEVLGEIALQYEGIGVSEPAYAAFFSLADELEVPIAVHLGPGPYDVFDVRPDYRVAAGDPLELESVLRRHPGLRIYVMHAGWPFIENMIAIMHTYRNVYIDTAFINTALPVEELYGVLQRFVAAGLGDRLMFGSDPHPGAISLSIETAISRIDGADFLSEEDKDRIFYQNATRFFRLDPGDR